METMTSNAMNRLIAEKILWKASEELRSALPVDHNLDVVLDVLLWARWIPSSEGALIGYFDAMRSLTNLDEWNSIQGAIAERSRSPLLPDTGIGRLKPEILERLRATLLPLGRVLNSGDPMEVKGVVEAMMSRKASNRMGGERACSLSMGGLWEALLASRPGEPVACLFPMGMAAAPVLGIERSLLMSPEIPSQEHWILGLLSLYPKEVGSLSIADHETWPLAIVAPPWGERTQELLIQDRWLPPSPLDCPSAIRDSEARRLFAAHQRCSGITYALMSPGIAFRTSKDLEYFREELVNMNWLDAVIDLPSGANAATSLGGLLLVLKKGRAAKTPIHMISAHEMLNPSKRKKLGQLWDANGISLLSKLVLDRSESSYARLITVAELAANGFSFQVSRYLHSESDLTLQRYLDSRTTVQLGDLAEIRRPVASLGRQDDDGIEVREVTPGDIDDSGRMRQGSKVIRIAEIAMAKGSQNLLETGDVLLSIKGGLGRVAIVQDLEHPTVPGQAFCVIRLRPNARLTPVALVQYLRSAVGQTLLNRAGQGATVAFVPMGEVKSLPIVIPGTSELKRVEAIEEESVALSREVEELSLRLQRLSRHGWLEDLPPNLLISDEEVPS